MVSIGNDSDITTPFLASEGATERENGDAVREDEEPKSRMKEELLRVGAMLGLVLIGLAVVLLIFFWPLMFGSFLPTPKGNTWVVVGYRIGIQVIHVLLLVFLPFPYLYLHRKVCHPIRIVLMPLVNEVSKSEGIREKEVTWYNKCSDLPQTRDPTVLLSRLKPSCRKDLRKKLKHFFENDITTRTVHSDFLSLQHDVPILWAHEQRAVQGTDKSVLEEFIKRFLVLFLVSHAYLDRYYDKDGKICALGQFVSCRNTMNNFMYFCLEEQSRCGIWQYHHFRGLLRAVASSSSSSKRIEYINFQVHQGYAKRLAGAVAADYKDDELLSNLYPFALYQRPPVSVIDLKIEKESIMGS
ncbi:unnamed protein product [Cylindrotheca closterium]|uniref:Uncharacterized protein n=1 Tax=Cylindrotheca closterium TaxID=2856 RepID=A0AAD2G4U3_9STRA|nr:unnamed protein product [Cylindrotheca closterium]